MKLKSIIIFLVFIASIFAQADEGSKKAKIDDLVSIMDMDSMVESLYSQMELMMQNMSEQMGVQPSEQPIFDEYYSQMVLVMKEDMNWKKWNHWL